MRRAGAANMVLCTSIQTIDEHETDTYGGGVHTQMSREAWPIQIAIIGAEANCDHRCGRANLGRLAGVFRDLLRCHGQALPLRRLFGCGVLVAVAAKRAGGRRALAMRRADLRNGGIREGNLYFLQAPFFIYKKAARSCAKPGWHGAKAVLYYGYNEGEKG